MNILLLFFMLSMGWSQTCDHTPTQFSCVKFLYNYDGDTLTFDIPGIHPYFGKKSKVRLHGIDTPELRPKGLAAPCETEWGRVAKRLVEAELKHAKRIDITKLNGRDKYGRILGQIEYDGKNLKDILLKNYLGVPYWGKKKVSVNWCDLKKRRETKK